MIQASIIIENLTVFTYIGVYEWEQTTPQKLLISVKINYDCSQAVLNDDPNSCLDYAKLSKEIIDFAKDNKFKLIETLGFQLLQKIKQNNPHVFSIFLQINKPNAVANAENIAVSFKLES